GEGQALRGAGHTVSANMTSIELDRASGVASAVILKGSAGPALTRLVAMGPAVLAAGMLALGIQSLVLHDFISGWQPVPQSWPAPAALAIDSAMLIIVCSAGMLTQRWRRHAGAGMAILLVAWLAGLHVPFIARGPTILAQWLGAGETTFILAGVLVLARNPAR